MSELYLSNGQLKEYENNNSVCKENRAKNKKNNNNKMVANFKYRYLAFFQTEICLTYF